MVWVGIGVTDGVLRVEDGVSVRVEGGCGGEDPREGCLEGGGGGIFLHDLRCVGNSIFQKGRPQWVQGAWFSRREVTTSCSPGR